MTSTPLLSDPLDENETAIETTDETAIVTTDEAPLGTTTDEVPATTSARRSLLRRFDLHF